METKKSLAEIEKSEATHFDDLYSKSLGEKRNLVLPEELIEKYKNPSSKPIDWKEYAMYLLGDVKGKKVLEYGCGGGEDAICLAKMGAIVSAFDISQEGVNITRLRAKENNVEDRVDARVMSGNKLDYETEEFDVILGSWILHHMDLDVALGEVWRVLKTGGKAVFLEPVVNSKGLDSIKHITKKMLPCKNYIGVYDSEDEEPLSYEKIATLKKKFRHVYYKEFSFFTKLGVFFHQKTFTRIFLTMDYLLFKYLPFARKFGTGVLIELRK
jgi:ubiquinone/menaquinone biosynthesis C-methylase UbiE